MQIGFGSKANHALRYSMGKQFSIKFNFNSEDVLLPQNTNICKIFIYILKKDNVDGDEDLQKDKNTQTQTKTNTKCF